MSIEWLAMVISIVALGISAATFWHDVLRRGRVKMTKPTQIGLGFRDAGGKNQVFVRAMLFATAPRGAVVENIYARVRRGERAQNFSVWVHGEPKAMLRGAGLKVTENGLTANFHFLLRHDEPDFEVASGNYDVDIFARLLNSQTEYCLSSSKITITEQMLMEKADVGVVFDWAPDSGEYIGYASEPPSRPRLGHYFEDLIAHIENSSPTKSGHQ